MKVNSRITESYPLAKEHNHEGPDVNWSTKLRKYVKVGLRIL